MPNFDPELVHLMRTALDDVMTRVRLSATMAFLSLALLGISGCGFSINRFSATEEVAKSFRVQGKPRQTMLEFFEGLSEVMFKFTGIIMCFAPFGVGAAVAHTIGQNGFGVLAGLGRSCVTVGSWKTVT